MTDLTGSETPTRAGRPMLGVAPPEFGSGDAAARADHVAAETLIRSTVQVLANGAAVKDVDSIIQRNLGNVTLADIRAGRLGSNVLGDIINSVEQAKGNAPFNWSAATPQQIDAYLAHNGMTLGARAALAAGNRANRSPDDGPASNSSAYAQGLPVNSAFLKSVGLSDGTGSALAAMGFKTPEQIRQIVGDAHKLGLAPEKAAIDLAELRKAEGSKTNAHVGELKRWGKTDRDLVAEQKEIDKITDPAVRARRQKEHDQKKKANDDHNHEYEEKKVGPNGKKAFKKLRDQIHQNNAALMHKADVDKPGPGVVGESHKRRVADIRKLGGERAVEDEHKKTVASLQPKAKDVIAAEADELAALASPLEAPASKPPAEQPKKPHVAEAKKPTSDPKRPKVPEQRQAANTKAQHPAV